MALPKEARNSLTPPEIEFIAENEIVTIIPSHRMDVMHLIGGSFGPFMPPLRTDVPLWLALMLKKNRKCTIQIPDWMEAERLQEKIDREKDNDAYTEMPLHYLEIANLLASDDIPHLEHVTSLLKTLHDLRSHKAIEDLKYLKAETVLTRPLKMNNLGMLEVNAIRPFYTRAFDEIRRLVGGDAAADGGKGGASGSAMM
ncbi:DNA replication protein psf2 [Blyttiomyces sp. JEL0837]|nr:DNA replication protein psf2 [Blyttiomyces sp. JEL0837]